MEKALFLIVVISVLIYILYIYMFNNQGKTEFITNNGIMYKKEKYFNIMYGREKRWLGIGKGISPLFIGIKQRLYGQE